MSTTMASFSDSEKQMGIDMQHENMMESGCCDNMSSGCEEYNHDCCISPFKDSSNINWISKTQNNKKIKIKVHSFDILALLQEWLENNYSERLNSPPYWIIWENDDNIFVWLTWIIKNNL